MQELYVTGNTFLYRLPANLKLALLVAVSIGLFLTTRLGIIAVFLVVAIGLYASLPLSLRQSITRLLPIGATIIIVGIINLILNGWQTSALTVMRFTTLMLFGAAITASTPVTDFIETITKWASPLEKMGLIRAADIGLAVGLVIRFVPDILSRYTAIQDAHKARGIPFRPKGVLIPLIILTLRDADTIANAIDARGIRGTTEKRKPT